MTAPKPPEEHKPPGRPTVMTEEVLRKLEDAFMNAFTDEMACLYAGIGKTALYEYCEKNPKFAERKELLKRTPDLKAQKTLVEDLNTVGGARFWATSRMSEFMPKSKVEHSGGIETNNVLTALTPKQEEIREKYERELQSTIVGATPPKTPEPVAVATATKEAEKPKGIALAEVGKTP